MNRTKTTKLPEKGHKMKKIACNLLSIYCMLVACSTAFSMSSNFHQERPSINSELLKIIGGKVVTAASAGVVLYGGYKLTANLDKECSLEVNADLTRCKVYLASRRQAKIFTSIAVPVAVGFIGWISYRKGLLTIFSSPKWYLKSALELAVATYIVSSVPGVVDTIKKSELFQRKTTTSTGKVLLQVDFDETSKLLDDLAFLHFLDIELSNLV